MSELMAVLLNGIAQIEYHRRKGLPDHQGAYLDKMDRRMDEGIEADGEIAIELVFDEDYVRQFPVHFGKPL